jgi:type VI secretion system protein ImpL
MFRLIVGGVIVLLAWMFCILLELPYTIAAIVTALVLAVVGLLFGLDKLRERRAARELEKAIAAQTARAPVRPDLAHEVAQMSAEFQKSLDALKKSRGGKNALYTLPWYTIIGPPGCGKTTALRNSGLEFPYVSGGGCVRGLGGTRNCDWWMTSDGVILDTAGRWSLEEDDRVEWLAFLDLLKRFRPDKPIHGIIVAVSVAELGGAYEAEVQRLAQRLRERVDEVQQRLRLSLPVYVIFTKCDLMPGFVETFGAMTREDRSQAWGQTAPLTKAIGAPGDYFARGFDELVEILETRSWKRMAEERKVSDREMVYAFPQQMAVLRQNMIDFVQHLFTEDIYRPTPRFRGVYFTSGTQEGRPIDRVMSRMAQAFGQPEVPLPMASVEQKSYFLRDLFAHIVFPDAGIAARSPEEIARQRRKVWITAGAIFTAAMLITGLPALSYVKNRALLASVAQDVDRVHRSLPERIDGPIDPRVIEPLRMHAATLAQYDEDGPPILLRMGLYQDEVYPALRELYAETVRAHVIEPLNDADMLALDELHARAEAGARPPPDETLASYDRLKLHLLLSNERPELSDDDRELIDRALSERWTTATSVQTSDRGWAQIRQNVDLYVDLLAAHDARFIERDVERVERTRAVFASMSPYDTAIDAMIAKLRAEGRDGPSIDQVCPDATYMVASHPVPYAFSRNGWDREIERMLEHDAPRYLGEHWVLGQPPPERPDQDRRRQLGALRSRYFERYADEWDAYIDSISYRRPANDGEHAIMLAQLTDVGCYQLLVREVERNVSIPDDSAQPSVADSILDRVGDRIEQRNPRIPGEVIDAAEARLDTDAEADPARFTPAMLRARFAGFVELAPRTASAANETPAAEYEEHLRFLYNALTLHDGSNLVPEQTVRARANEATERIITERPEAWRPRIRALLTPPLGDASGP